MKKNLYRKELAGFKPYVPGKPIEEVKREYGLTDIVKLASNENPLGPSPLAMEAVIRAVKDINLYPESTAVELKRDLAVYLGVKVENLVIGNGGEELLMLIAQTFINEGDEVVVTAPSFGIYNTSTCLMGARIITVPLQKKNFDISGYCMAVTDKTKLIYLCNPNNPTGNIITKTELDELLKKIPKNVVVVLDEAYYEFASVNPDYPKSLGYLEERPNTIILRTFSKVSGIAGVRIGYLVTSEENAAEMNKIKLTFNVNRLAQEAARGALRDQEHIQKTVELNYKSLSMMEAYFNKKEFDFFPSNANFIFVNAKQHSKIIFEELMKKGIIIRPGYFWGWDTWLRVSTGTEAQTQKFIDELEVILCKG
ncbi:MAG: histidinol-phosphate transaminase [Eubacteriales bacterium]|nr:histidinol-phosphate transaminase [Eubacteriales bacterium]MDD4582657.1 histidinol-phosphate transaminase [Eubacteriales bacterium]